MLAAVDALGIRHLLVRVDDTARVRAPRPVAGLALSVRRLHPFGEEHDAAWLDFPHRTHKE